jgi:PBSX family phage terminase large subunit
MELIPDPSQGPRKRISSKRRKPYTKRAKDAVPLKQNKPQEEFYANRKAVAQKPDKAAVVDADILAYATTPEAEAARERKVIWQPFPGPQMEFLASDEEEVLFSGGRGSGKTTCLMVDPLRYCTNKKFRALIVRRTMPELRSLISEAKDLYFQAFPGVKWKEQEKMFVFPSGATIEFGYCDNVDDVERYRGQQYTWLGIDELTQFPTPEVYNKFKGSLRTTDASLKIYVRATTNPTGKGRWWVREYFVDCAPPGKTFALEYDTPIGKLRTTRKWFNSTVMDNPAIIKNNPQYLATLASMPDALRKQWLEGSWDAIDGMAFPDFSTSVHVIPPFKVPHSWLKFRGCDWGYSSRAACVWLASDHDNNLYVYREFGANGAVKANAFPQQARLTADAFAKAVVEREVGDNVKYGVMDASTWAHRGDSGPSIAEEMILNGCLWRPSDRSAGSRKAAVMKMHQYLKVDEFTGKPKIFIFDTCKELIKCLSSLPLDPNDPEDVDTKADDHFWDALMYALMSRPNLASGYDDWLSKTTDNRPVVIDSTFGY